MKQGVKRVVSIFASLLLVGGSFAVYSFLIQPAYDGTQALRGKVQSEQDFIDRYSKPVEEVQKLISQYQQQSSLRDAISLALPFDPDLIGALTQLTSIVDKDGLTPTTFSATKTTLPPEKKSAASSSVTASRRPSAPLQFRIHMSGSYENLKTFLKDVETNVRLFDVQTLNMSPSVKTESGGFEYDVSLTAYYQPN